MANFYVDKSAADDTGDGSIGNPKKFVNTGIALVSSNGDVVNISEDNYAGAEFGGGFAYCNIPTSLNNLAFTIQPWVGTGGSSLSFTGTTFDMRVRGDGGSVTLKDLEMNGTVNGIFTDTGSTTDVICDNSIMGKVGKTDRSYIGQAPDGVNPERLLSVQNGSTMRGPIAMDASRAINVINSTIDSLATSWAALQLSSGIGDILIQNSTILSGGTKPIFSFKDQSPSLDYIAGSIEIDNNLLTRAKTQCIDIVVVKADSVSITNNIISSTSASGVQTGIAIGRDFHIVDRELGLSAVDGV